MCCGAMAVTGCVGTAILAPSALIVPDAITLGIADRQVFTVQNATVARFTITCDEGSWQSFVRATPVDSNRIELVTLKATRQGHIFVAADLGPSRSPLVAVVSIRSN